MGRQPSKYLDLVNVLLDGKTVEILGDEVFNASSLRTALSREIARTPEELLPDARTLKIVKTRTADGKTKFRIWLIDQSENLCYTVVNERSSSDDTAG
jgi:hypothetical protein